MTMMKILVFMAASLSLSMSMELPQSSDATTESNDCVCEWTLWLNNDDFDPFVGDNNSYVNLRRQHDVCRKPKDIECRSKINPQVPFLFLEREEVHCDINNGLVCVSRPLTASQFSNRKLRKGLKPFHCDDYEVRVQCCDCPETTLSPRSDVVVTTNEPSLLRSFINTTTTTANSTSQNITVTEKDVGTLQLIIPVSIIIVLAVAVVVVIAIVLCVSLRKKEKKSPKHVDDYMEGHSYLQRPVSFTDVDLPKCASTSSLARSSSDSSSCLSYKLTRLDRGKLQFVQTDEPDVISSNRATEPFLHQDSEARQWFPDETAMNLVKQPKPGKKTRFARSLSPNSSVGKSLSFDEENQ